MELENKQAADDGQLLRKNLGSKADKMSKDCSNIVNTRFEYNNTRSKSES